MVKYMTKKEVGIIGGGLSGLTVAYYLSKESDNYKITLFEKEKKLGGRIQTKKIQNFPLDLGAQFFIYNGVFYNIIKELNIKNNKILKMEDNFLSFFNDNDIYTTDQLLKSENLDDSDEFKLLIKFVKNDIKNDDLNSITFDEWYKKNIGYKSIQLTDRIFKSMGFQYLNSINARFGLTLLDALFIRKNCVIKGGLETAIYEMQKKIFDRGGSVLKNTPCLDILKINEKYQIKYLSNGKPLDKVFDILVSAITPEDLIKIFDDKFMTYLKKIKSQKLNMYAIETNKKLWHNSWGLIINNKESPIYLLCDNSNVTKNYKNIPIVAVCSPETSSKQALNELKKRFNNKKLECITLFEKKWDIGLHQPDEEYFKIRKEIKNKSPENFYLAGDWMSLPSMEGAVTSGYKVANSIMKNYQ